MTELLPALFDIIQPSFRPVRCGDFSDIWVTVVHFMYDPEVSVTGEHSAVQRSRKAGVGKPHFDHDRLQHHLRAGVESH